MKNKKITVIRLIIFYTLAILPLCILTPVFRNFLGEPLFTGDAAVSRLTSTYGILSMCTPALANVFTRLITREGLKDAYLDLDLKDKKWKYYLIAILLPITYMLISAMLILLVCCNSATHWFEKTDLVPKLWMYLGQIGTTLLIILPFFGEEFGWRAYLTPKLETLFPMPVALVLSGILWGLWHAPLTVQGHNFGMDYIGFPFLGILLMCTLCTAMSAILTLITKRTNSVLPAAILHGINNNMSANILLSLFATEEVLTLYETSGKLAGMTLMLIPICIIGAVCFVILCKEAKQTT